MEIRNARFDKYYGEEIITDRRQNCNSFTFENKYDTILEVCIYSSEDRALPSGGRSGGSSPSRCVLNK